MIDTSPMPQGRQLPTQGWEFDGFNLGVNNFSLATELRGNELASATNAELFGKKSLRPRRGGLTLGNGVGGDRIDALFQYKEDAINDLLSVSGGLLKKYDSSTGNWGAISGGTFSSGSRVRGVKAQGNLYFGNGINDFARYNGTIVQSFAAVAAPTGLAVSPQGGTATSEYTYQITTVTDKGQSLPTAEVAISNGSDTLSGSLFNRVTFTRRTETQVIGYNIFGRAKTGLGLTLMIFIDQPASGATITFDDSGVVAPQVWLPPEGDSTDGPVLTMWEQLRGSLVGAGDPTARHRLYYSGTGARYESFSPSHNGGWIDVRPGDNDYGINGLAPFESKIMIGKQNSIHQFFFSSTDGEALIQEVISYVGVGAAGSMVVMENDIGFIDSESKFRILGYEPNFAAVRTASLSEGRAQSLLDQVDPSYIDNCEAVYFEGRYYLAITTAGHTQNNKVIVYDRKYLAFLGDWYGSDCEVRCWIIYDGIDRKRRLYAGSSTSDSVFEFEKEGYIANHDGTEIITTIRTRNEDIGNSGQQKLFKWADLRLYRVQGSVEVKTIINGATILDTESFSNVVNSGWGIARWGTMKWGISSGTPAAASDYDKTYRKEIYEIANSLQFEVTKRGTQSDFVLVSMRGEALLLPTEVFDTANVI